MAKDSFRDFVLDQLGGLDVYARPMFGAFGLYLGPKFFGMVSGGRLYFKTNEKTREKYEHRGMDPFVYRPQKVLKNYYEVPLAVVDDTNELKIWAEEAADVR